MPSVAKPVVLVADAMLNWSQPGEVVLDNFPGSGATVVAAQRTGRRCSPLRLERLIGATEPLDLGALAPFVDFAEAEKPAWEDRLANRRVPDSMRAAVLVRDGGRCRKCRRSINLEMDHIIPVSKGGRTEEVNLQTLCRRCNRAKARKLVPVL
jgi:HNH endonuclease/DNA methylase